MLARLGKGGKRCLVALLCAMGLVGVAAHSTQAAMEASLSDTPEKIREFFGGTEQAKLVFENNGYLYFVDFSQSDAQIQKMVNTSGAVAPMISPDGQYVTYATGVTSDGKTSQASTAWICELKADAQPIEVAADNGYNPRFVYNAEKPTVLYATCGAHSEAGKYAWDGCGKMMTRELNNGTLGDPQTLYDGGSYFAGMSYDGRYLATAEQSLNAYMLDLQNPGEGPVKLLHLPFKAYTVNGEDTTYRDTMLDLQACNPSISSSPDNPDQMMLLDFGFSRPNLMSPQMGHSWGLHDRIFIMNYQKDVVDFIDYPDARTILSSAEADVGDVVDVQWDDPEWTNHPNFAAANLLVDRLGNDGSWIHGKNREIVFAINLTEKKVKKLVEASDTTMEGETKQTVLEKTNMQWPWLWIHESASDIRSHGESFSREGIVISNGTVSAEMGLTSVRIYRPNGRLVKALAPSAALRTVKLRPELFPGTGTYFVRLRDAEGGRHTVRMTVDR